MSVAGRGNRGLRYGVRGSEGELKELQLLRVTAQQGVSEGWGGKTSSPQARSCRLFSAMARSPLRIGVGGSRPLRGRSGAVEVCCGDSPL